MIHLGVEIEQNPELLEKDYSKEGQDFKELIGKLKLIYKKIKPIGKISLKILKEFPKKQQRELIDFIKCLKK